MKRCVSCQLSRPDYDLRVTFRSLEVLSPAGVALVPPGQAVCRGCLLHAFPTDLEVLT